MVIGRGKIGGKALRLALASGLATLCLAVPALAQMVPAGFLDNVPSSKNPASIEADLLSYDGRSDVILASGDVVMSHEGYTAGGQQLVYNRSTGALEFVGDVTITDPAGTVFTADSIEVTGEMKQAFLKSLTLTFADGSQITAADVSYEAALQTMLTDSSYSPCGECVDSKGRKIGWKVRAARIVVDHEKKTTYIEQPQLELLGMPIASLPFLWLPDPETPFLKGLQMPSFDYDEDYGAKLVVPYQMTVGPGTDIIFTPSLYSRQGFLMGVEWVQRMDMGAFRVKASGIYQLDREAFAGQVGDRDWRGAVQTSGEFTPFKRWTVGWSYTAFTDAGYLKDYGLEVGKSTVNQVYTQYLDSSIFADVRAQKFNQLGNITEAKQGQQGEAVPAARFDTVQALPNGLGQIDVSARLLGVNREYNMVETDSGVNFVTGYAGSKVHGTLQAGWQTQWIGPAGLVLSPYLGWRGDYASYDGLSSLASAPEEQTLYTSTPIAALDLRWPLAVTMGQNVHIIEPIAQLAYRGSDTTLVGITNDNAQSFVFDDTNLFSFDRFSGTDRQETGLRANVGVHYLANFDGGSYLDFLVGQSFHLDGTNAYDTVDGAQVGGESSGLAGDASYIVLGMQGSPFQGLTGGGKLQINPDEGQITRASLAGSMTYEGYNFGLDYRYVAADMTIGVEKNQHELGANVGIPLDDYWRMTAGAYWDLEANTWLQVRGGLLYDDGYLLFGVNGGLNGPTHEKTKSGEDYSATIAATFKLKAPGDFSIGF